MNAIAFTLNELAQRFGGTVAGNGNCRLTGIAPLDQATRSELSFLTNPKYISQVGSTAAAAVLMTPADFEKLGDPDSADRSYLLTANPYAHFARIAQTFASLAQPEEPGGVHATAVIDPTAQIAEDARIGPSVVIEAGAVIGARVRLDAHVTIGKQVRIGAQSHLYPSVSVYAGCVLGERVIVHSGAVIGADGFGFAPDFAADGHGEWVKIPQVGRVSIADDVEIGANTTIDRGTLGDTVIEQGVKIDNLVQIGHNCKIGAYTVIAGCAGIAGSTTVGKHCIIGGAVGIAGHLTLADHVTIAAKSGVSKSLNKAGVYNSAFPAIEHAVWNRNAALMRNLDTMRARLKRLEAQLAEQ